jgi:hypothetical protein
MQAGSFQKTFKLSMKNGRPAQKQQAQSIQENCKIEVVTRSKHQIMCSVVQQIQILTRRCCQYHVH